MDEVNRPSNERASERDRRIRRVLDECLRRRSAGETVPDDAVIAEHSDLMPELEERLKALKLIEQVGAQECGTGFQPVSKGPSEGAPGQIEGRCPQCRARWRVRVENAGRRARCKKCGKVFFADIPGNATVTAPGRSAGGGMPDAIPGYRIESELGHGGMGRVYLARELSTKRQVALKVMLAGRYADERQRRRFEREVEIAASLEHPNIARLYASGLHQGHHWFAMEYVEGERLDAYAAEKRPGLHDLLTLFASICEAVNHAHQRGVMHRDLKPGNIMVDAEGQPRVLDFGLAKLLDQPDAAEESISLLGEVMGTPAYMSPEQTRGDSALIDVRSDVYSLGVVLYRLLTGESPYGTKESSLTELLRAISEIDPQPPRRLRREIPDEVSSIVLKSLEKVPAHRYQSAGDMGRDIAAHLNGEPVSAKQGSGWYMLRKTAIRYKGPGATVAAVIVLSLTLGVTMAAKWSTTKTELKEVIREVEVLREVAGERGLASAQELSEKEEIVRRLAYEYVAAFQLEDATPFERFQQLLAEDIVATMSFGVVYRGKQDVLGFYREATRVIREEMSELSLTFDIDSVSMTAARAVVFGKVRIAGLVKDSGTPLTRDVWETLVFEETGEQWHVALVHSTSTEDLRGQLTQARTEIEDLRAQLDRETGFNPPAPDPANPVNYIKWINDTLGLDNAADDYLAASATLKTCDGDIGKVVDHTDANPEEVAAWLAPQQTALEQVRRAAQKPRCFFPVPDPPPTGDPRVDHAWGRLETPTAPFRAFTGAVALIPDGYLSWKRGDRERLALNAMTLIRMGHHVADNFQHLPGVHLGSRCLDDGYSLLRMAIHLSEEPAVTCRELLPKLEEADSEPRFYTVSACAFLRLAWWDTCQRLFVPGRQPGTWELYPALADSDEDYNAKLRQIGFENTLRGVNAYLDDTLRLLTGTYSGREQVRAALESFQRKWGGSENPLVSQQLHQFLQPTAGWLSSHSRQVAAHRGTHLLVHVFAHQAATGRLPESLADLSLPDGGKIRTDPFGNADFIYKRKGQDFTLYSLAENFKDDGGVHHAEWGEMREGGRTKEIVTGDYVFWPVQE